MPTPDGFSQQENPEVGCWEAAWPRPLSPFQQGGGISGDLSPGGLEPQCLPVSRELGCIGCRRLR